MERPDVDAVGLDSERVELAVAKLDVVGWTLFISVIFLTRKYPKT